MLSLRILVLTLFLGSVAVSGIDLWLSKFTEHSTEPSVRITLQTREGSLLDEGRPVQVNVATRKEADGTFLCVTAIYEFPDDADRIAELNTPNGEVPSVSIKGPLVLLYGDAPLTNRPDQFDPGFVFRPQIQIADIDWTPIPPGYPIDEMVLTLPTLDVFRPDPSPGDGSLLAFAYSGGCFLIEDVPSKAEGLAKAQYTFAWGDRASSPAVSSETSTTPVTWTFMENPGDAVSDIDPPATSSEDGWPTHEFFYNDTFSVEILVTATRVQAWVTLANWAAVGLGGLTLGALFQFLFRKRKDSTAKA